MSGREQDEGREFEARQLELGSTGSENSAVGTSRSL